MRQVVVDGAVVTPLWPPTGIALAALLYLGVRVWPGIALGTLLTVVEIGDAFTVSRLAIMFGNTVAPLASYALLRWAASAVSWSGCGTGSVWSSSARSRGC